MGPPPPDNWPTQEGPANAGGIETEVLALGPGVRPGVQQQPQYPAQRPQYPAGAQRPQYPAGALSIQAIRGKMSSFYPVLRNLYLHSYPALVHEKIIKIFNLESEAVYFGSEQKERLHSSHHCLIFNFT